MQVVGCLALYLIFLHGIKMKIIVSTDFGTCSYQCFLSNYYYYYHHHHHHHKLVFFIYTEYLDIHGKLLDILMPAQCTWFCENNEMPAADLQ